MKGLTYSRCGDYYIPDLKLSEQAGTPIGKYGRMRKRYLEKHRPIFYNNLILKAADQMRWVGLMNTLKAQAEETILSELIFGEGGE